MKSDTLSYSAIAITIIICVTVLIMRIFVPVLNPRPVVNPGTMTGPNAELMDQLQRINTRLDALEKKSGMVPATRTNRDEARKTLLNTIP
jgi:hypothetical protein